MESGSGSITWNNKPPAGSALATTTITNNVVRWYEWDITAYIQAEKAANRNTVESGGQEHGEQHPLCDFQRA